MKRGYLIIAFISALLIGCSESSQFERYSKIEYGIFSIDIPSSWSQFSEHGIDSEVLGIVTDKYDTINIHSGIYTPDFEDPVQIFSLRDKIHFDSISWPYVDEMIFSSNSVVEERQGAYLNEYYLFDTIDGKRAKIMLPKIVGQGAMGIHFDSLNTNGDDMMIYTSNLDSLAQMQLYKSFMTIRFK
jgi:hypothetical protein